MLCHRSAKLAKQHYALAAVCAFVYVCVEREWGQIRAMLQVLMHRISECFSTTGCVPAAG